jgi:hypothetical protein
LVSFISDDDFWKAQIQQFMSWSGELQMVPLGGNSLLNLESPKDIKQAQESESSL